MNNQISFRGNFSLKLILILLYFQHHYREIKTKKMKLYLSISILLFLSATVFSQKIYPIEFDNYQPKWTFISGDLKDTIHTFFTKSPIIFEENVYFVSNVIGVFYNGYQVDQVDKESGIKGWSQSFTTQEHDREFVSNYFINSNREFELLTMKEYNNDYFIWEDASFMNRTFDLSTGDEISNLFFNQIFSVTKGIKG